MRADLLVGDVFDRIATIGDGTVDLVVTSPPFLALRSYLLPDDPKKPYEIGSEGTPAAFLSVMLRLTDEFRRVLAPHGSIAAPNMIMFIVDGNVELYGPGFAVSLGGLPQTYESLLAAGVVALDCADPSNAELRDRIKAAQIGQPPWPTQVTMTGTLS